MKCMSFLMNTVERAKMYSSLIVQSYRTAIAGFLISGVWHLTDVLPWYEPIGRIEMVTVDAPVLVFLPKFS